MNDDTRDERMADRLRVGPLDDVTRARLVRNAMAATATAPEGSTKWTSRARMLGIAAVLVALLAVGLAVVVREGESGSGPTAADAPNVFDDRRFERLSPAEGREFDASALDNREDSAAAGTVPALGDLGDVGSAAKVRRAVAAAVTPTANAPDAAAPAPTDRLAPRVTTCAGAATAARLGDVVAVGTGTADGEPVTVYVVERERGTRVAVVVDADCVARDPVRL